MQLIYTIGYFILFLLAYFCVIYPVGYLITQKFSKNLKPVELLTISLALSTVLFVLSAIILGVIGLRFYTLPIFVGLSIVSLWKYRLAVFVPIKELFSKKILISLTLIAIVIQGVINFPSGYLFSRGLEFWSSQGNDGLWHVAVMEEVKKSMPVENPIFAGEKLYNYHYLTDILMGEFGRVFPMFTSLDLYFRFFPVIFSLLISLSVFSFVSRWRKSEAAGYWAIFFSSLAGGFGYVVTLIKAGILFGGETVFWAAQGNTIIGNPPHAVAYGLLATFLLTIAVYLETRKKEILILSILLGSFVAGFKVSGGFILSTGIIAGGIYDFLINRKKEMIYVPVIVGLLNFLTLKLMTKGADSFLVFEPWWFVRTTIVADGRVGWMDMEFRRQHYVAQHTFKATLRVIQLETEAFLMFVVGNLGLRIIGIFMPFINGFKKVGAFFKDTMNVVLLSSMLAGLGIVLLFVQRGIAYNLIQFMQYFIFIFGFYSASLMAILIARTKKVWLKVVIALTVILLSLPTVIGNLVEFYGKERTPLAYVSNEEIEALTFLKRNSPSESLVLTKPFDDGARYGYKSQPWPISVWYATPYVSAISARRTYLSNEGQVDILGLPWKERKEEVDKFFGTSDNKYKLEFLQNNNISYVYVRKVDLKMAINEKLLGLKRIFENNEVIIYKGI